MAGVLSLSHFRCRGCVGPSFSVLCVLSVLII